MQSLSAIEGDAQQRCRISERVHSPQNKMREFLVEEILGGRDEIYSPRHNVVAQCRLQACQENSREVAQCQSLLHVVAQERLQALAQGFVNVILNPLIRQPYPTAIPR